MLANFQEGNVIVIHYIGAFLAFGCGLIYIWAQTLFSYLMNPKINFVEHVLGTCSEWGLAICFQLYILSFAIELRHAYCHAPKLRLIPYSNDGGESAAILAYDFPMTDKVYQSA
uniref:CWH43-like N-terminal domain-containing protein n=1 Tax=Panagrolaimus superbus TaxID=310955 RepID=A0A914YZK9_9BILA